MVRRLCLAFAVSLLCGLNGGWGEERRMENFEEKILQDMPQDVVDFVLRVDGCIHWQGERPYDEDRAADILSAVHELQCRKLPQDHAGLSGKYSGRAKIRDTLNQLTEFLKVPSHGPIAVDGLRDGMPPDVADAVLRADRCRYWKITLDQRRPEDDLDDAAETIPEPLRCKDLPTDLAWLSEQYASDGAVMTTLKHLREHYLR
jgi:hypothetical protein